MQIRTNYIICTLIILSNFSIGFSQEKTEKEKTPISSNANEIVWDLDSETSISSLPYDKSFNLKLHKKNIGLAYDFYLYKHKGNKDYLESILSEKNPLNYLSKFKKTSINNNTVKLHFKYDSSLNYPFDLNASVKINYILKRVFRPFNTHSTLLKPNSRYSIIAYQFRNYKEIEEKLNLIKQNNTDKIELEKKLIAYEKKYLSENGVSTTSFNSKCYVDCNLVVYNNVKEIEEAAVSMIKSFSDFSAHQEGCKSICQKIELSFRYLNRNNPKFVNCVSNCKLDSIYVSLNNFQKNSTYFQSILLGKLKLTDPCNYTIITDEHIKLDNELTESTSEKVLILKANLSKSLDYLRTLRTFFTNIELAYNSDHKAKELDSIINIEKNIDALSDIFVMQSLKLTEIESELEKKFEILKQSGFYDKTYIQKIDSHVFSFESRNKISITPVFGYAVYGLQKDFISYTPYLGFQINFAGLNNDIPFRLIKDKTLKQRMSFITAWTLLSVAEKQKRYDLFSKGTLLTGLGFKISHIVMVNGGTVWFKRGNYNQLIGEKKIAITPFLSLSINAEIKELLNGFLDLISIK